MSEMFSAIGKRIWLLVADLTVVAVALGALGIGGFCIFMVLVVRGWLR